MSSIWWYLNTNYTCTSCVSQVRNWGGSHLTDSGTGCCCNPPTFYLCVWLKIVTVWNCQVLSVVKWPVWISTHCLIHCVVFYINLILFTVKVTHVYICLFNALNYKYDIIVVLILHVLIIWKKCSYSLSQSM